MAHRVAKQASMTTNLNHRLSSATEAFRSLGVSDSDSDNNGNVNGNAGNVNSDNINVNNGVTKDEETLSPLGSSVWYVLYSTTII